MINLHILMTRYETLVLYYGFIIMEATGCSPSTFLTQRLIRFEVIALSLVLILILVFIRAIGPIMVQVYILFRHIQAIHICLVSLANHYEYIYRCQSYQNQSKTSTPHYIVFMNIFRLLVTPSLKVFEFFLQLFPDYSILLVLKDVDSLLLNGFILLQYVLIILRSQTLDVCNLSLKIHILALINHQPYTSEDEKAYQPLSDLFFHKFQFGINFI